MRLLFLAALLCCLWAAPVRGDIWRFADTELTVGLLSYRRVAMYAPGDAPSSGAPGNDRSFIRPRFRFDAPKGQRYTGLLDVAIVRTADLSVLGVMRPDDKDPTKMSRRWCCTEDLRDEGVKGCDRLGMLIIPAEVLHWAKPVEFKETSVAYLREENMYNVKETGHYTMMIANCDAALPHVTFSGTGEWMNPYGYLPGELYGFMPFYFYMSVFFLVMCAVWGLLNAVYWQSVVSVQHFVSCVLGLCLVECVVWHFDYRNFNNTGVRHVGVVVTGIFLSVIRRTLSRMLLISVALGYGVIRPSLGAAKNKIIALGVVYFVFESLLELVLRYEQTSEVDDMLRLLCSVPVAAVDAILYWWTFVALYEVMAQLKTRRQDHKLALYTTFTRALVFSLVAAFAFAAFQLWYTLTLQIRDNWSIAWLLNGGYWQMLYSFMIIVVAWLWKPSKDSQRYGYMQVVHEEDDDFSLELEGGPSGAGPGQGMSYGIDDDALNTDNVFTIGDEGDETPASDE